MFKKVNEGSGNGANYLKIESGTSVTGVFRGDVYEFFQAWPKGGMKKVSSEPFEGAKRRFKVNIVIHEGGKFVAKVWEFGARVNNQLADIAEEYDLTKTKIKISRQGSDKNTNWSIMPITKEPLTAKHLKEIDNVELNQLEGPSEASADVSLGEGFDDEIPF
jgi:hypothetical protein